MVQSLPQCISTSEAALSYCYPGYLLSAAVDSNTEEMILDFRTRFSQEVCFIAELCVVNINVACIYGCKGEVRVVCPDQAVRHRVDYQFVNRG